MRRAIKLAHKGRFTVSPNPRVGCVVVLPESDSPEDIPQVIGEGFHLRRGLPHAEREALKNCIKSPLGATMYVTLEPCCHTGVTPPCTDAILEAGIKRVVVAARDPFPQVSGKGIDRLRKEGILVHIGLLEEEARYENRYFFHRHERNLPWVILKAATSLDGKLATHRGHSKWITGKEARAHVHELRAEVDAIIAGIGTVLADDPLLTARLSIPHENELIPSTRVILDPRGRIPIPCQLLDTLNEAPVHLFASNLMPEEQKERLETLGVRVDRVKGNEHQLDLREILEILAQENVLSVLVEGGGHVHTSFLERSLVNEAAIYIAPVLIGGTDSPTFYMGQGVGTMKDAKRVERVERHMLGPDTLIRGILNWGL